MSRSLAAWPIRRLLGLLLLLAALLPVLVILRFEFGAAAHEPIAIDEWYFLSCAVRGLAVGEVPVAGCHDTKPPMVFLVHQLVQPSAQSYDVIRVKLAAVFCTVLLVTLTGVLAWRLFGGFAGAIAATALMVVLGSDAYLLALKTEVVGSIFMLAALLILAWSSQGPRVWQVAAAGTLLGLALMSKQTFVFALLPAGLWLLVREWRSTPNRPLRALAMAGLLGFASALPLTVFILLFRQMGTLDEFLVSTFVYHRVYSGAPVGSWAQHFAWKIGGLGEMLLSVPLVTALAVAALLQPRRSQDGAAGSDRIWLIAAVAAGMVALLLIAAVQFAYHMLPAWTAMAVLAGAAATRWVEESDSLSGARLAVGLLGVAVALHGVASWYGLGGKKQAPGEVRHVPVLPQADQGAAAYVLGTWPAFYVVNKMIPASGVMYPNALPGGPATWAYRPPDPATARGRELIALQESNAKQLLSDFERMPPRFVMVVDKSARTAGSLRWTDIAVLENYLRDRCQPDRPVSGGSLEQGTLFRCRE